MPNEPEMPKEKQVRPTAGEGGAAPVQPSAPLMDVKGLAPAEAAQLAPTEDQLFYLRVLTRHLCSRKGIKTLALADSAGVKGDQEQRENKAQAFLNRFSRGQGAVADYQAFRQGVLKLRDEFAKKRIDLFDDPIMRQAFAVVFPDADPSDPDDDTFMDEPLGKWFSINPQRSRSVCEGYCGLWWVVRPSTTRSRPERATQPEPEFSVSLLNIVPEDAAKSKLPLFTFRQPVGGTSGGVSSHGRVLALDSDHQVLLLGKRRGSQTPTQLSWKYMWDLDHHQHESVIDGTIFTVNTNRVQIQSYFYGCYIEGTALLRGSEFEEANKLLRRFLGIKTEAELEDVPTSLDEVRLLMPLQASADEPPVGRSGLQDHPPSHRPIVSARGLERLKAIPQGGPILTIG